MKSNIKINLISILLICFVSGMAYAEIPPTPINLESDIINSGWVNYTWAAGVGNVTDTWNISMSISGATRTWNNSSALASCNTYVGLDEWVEIWVYAYNTTGDGNLSAEYAYSDTQADRSTFGETVDLMNAVPDILNPVVDIIGVVISIMIVLAIGALVTGTLGTIVEGIRKKIKL